jgi:hypothetical protein
MKTAIAVLAAAACLAAACSESTPAVQKLDERAVAVGIMAVQWPKVVAAGSDFAVKAVIRNASGVTIPSQAARGDGALQVNATYHWWSMERKPVVWDGILTPLKADLAPGGEQQLDLAVKAPGTPGVYVLELDLVQNTAFWFGGAGSQTATMIVEVK